MSEDYLKAEEQRLIEKYGVNSIDEVLAHQKKQLKGKKGLKMD